MKAYVIIMIISGESPDEIFNIEAVGVCSSLKKAMKYINELDKHTIDEDDVDIMYDILEYDMDTKPALLEYLEEQAKIRKSEMQKDLIELMDRGLIDQLIGEDGNFYYQLTTLGKDIVKQGGGITDNIKNLLKKDI